MTKSASSSVTDLKSTLAKLRLERREIKITLRGLQDDSLLQESFAVLRSVQRRYQPLCRTVCLSSNLTEEVVARATADEEGQRVGASLCEPNTAASSKRPSPSLHKKLSSAGREAMILRKIDGKHSKSEENGPVNDDEEASSYWNAIEVEGLQRLCVSFGLLTQANSSDHASEGTKSKVIDSSFTRPPVLLGAKRTRSPRNDKGSTSRTKGDFVSRKTFSIASRLHEAALSPSASTSPTPTAPAFHDLYSYAYGTNVESPTAGVFLRQALQRQLAIWGAHQLTLARASVPEGESSSADQLQHHIASYLYGLERVRIIPFFHEATRVASFAVLIEEDVEGEAQGGQFTVLLVDPTIEVGERHLPQLLDGLQAAFRAQRIQRQQQEEQNKGEKNTSTVVKVSIQIILTHIPRDCQIGVEAVRHCIDVANSRTESCVNDENDGVGSESLQEDQPLVFSFYGVHYRRCPSSLPSLTSIDADRTAVATSPSAACCDSLPLPPQRLSGSVSLSFDLVPCDGYSSDSAIIEMRLINSGLSSSSSLPPPPFEDENDNPSAPSPSSHSLNLCSPSITIAAFLPPTVGLDGICRLDYLIEEEMHLAEARKKKTTITATKSAAANEQNSSTQQSVKNVSTNDGSLGACGGGGHSAVAKASMKAAARYHQSLAYVAKHYLGYGGSNASDGSNSSNNRKTIGDGLVVFASRGGYNCSNGMLEAHWATTVAEWKHQQHTRPFWAAVTAGASEERANAASTNTKGGNATTAAVTAAVVASDVSTDPLDTFVAYLDKQQVLLDPLHPPLPKLLNSQRNLRLNLMQLGAAGGASHAQSVPSSAASTEPMLIAVDLRPVPEYLAHPTPNTVNVAFLPLFAPPSTLYKRHHHHHAPCEVHEVHALPAATPATVQLGAKKPEQWLGSFVSMDDGDGLLMVVPEAEWTLSTGKAKTIGGGGKDRDLLLHHYPRPLASLAQRSPHRVNTTNGATLFMLTLRQRLEHMGLMEYTTDKRRQKENEEVSGEQRIWVIGHTSYVEWLKAQSSSASSSSFSTSTVYSHPFAFSTTPYDHRTLRLNSCEDLAVLNLSSTSPSFGTNARTGKTLDTNAAVNNVNANGRVEAEEGDSAAAQQVLPKTIVVDIRTHAEFKNGSHRNSVHYSMWELLEDWRKEFVSRLRASSTRSIMSDTKEEHAAKEGRGKDIPRWITRFATKALDAGVIMPEGRSVNSEGGTSENHLLASNSSTPPEPTRFLSPSEHEGAPQSPSCPLSMSIALYCAGGYRSHISASLLRSVPLGLLSSGLLSTEADTKSNKSNNTTTNTNRDTHCESDDNTRSNDIDNIDNYCRPRTSSTSFRRVPAESYPIPTYFDVAGGAFQLMTMRPDLWHVKDRSVICVS